MRVRAAPEGRYKTFAGVRWWDHVQNAMTFD